MDHRFGTGQRGTDGKPDVTDEWGDYTAPASVTLMAAAADSDGSVAKVEFYRWGDQAWRSVSAPYTLTWSGVAAGSYSLTAVVTDNWMRRPDLGEHHSQRHWQCIADGKHDVTDEWGELHGTGERDTDGCGGGQ